MCSASLHRDAVLHRDLAVQRAAQAEDHTAFGLFGDGQRIDHVVGIERDGDAIDLHVAVRSNRDPGDLRAEAVRVFAEDS